MVALAAALTAACNRGTGGGSGGSGGTDVAAKVNGKDILLKEVDQLISQQVGPQAKISPLERATARLQVLDELIQQEVMYQRAQKENLLPNEEEVTQAINAKKREANMTQEEYQNMLKESGQTEETLREIARKQIAIQKLLEKTVSNISISNNEVESFYGNNKERFVSPRGVALSAIFVDPSDSAGQYPDDARNELEAKTKIDNVHAQLRGGADFATVARQRSEDPSIVRSGDFGFWDEPKLKQAGLPQDVVNGLFNSMKPGDITGPIRLEDGRYVILKLTDKRVQPENLTLDSPGVRDQIKQALVSERQRILGTALREVAMNEAKVENYLAQNMLKDPSMLGGLEPASPEGAASPAAGTATPAASPAATASPAGAASPGAK